MDEYTKIETARAIICDMCKCLYPDEDCPGKCDWMKCLKEDVADVAPVVHGKWIEYPRPHYFKCRECKYTVPYRKAMLRSGKREYHFCPNCGAKMDSEVE